MLSSAFVEEVFLKFYDLVLFKNLPVQGSDFSPILSFGEKLLAGEQLTQNQATYILKILEKYKNMSAQAGYDYSNSLGFLTWKNSFRVLDLSKKIWVDQAEDGKIWVCLKFPYQLKKEFDEEIVGDKQWLPLSIWDADQRIRKLSLYDFNLIHLYDFAVKHTFEIDESFMTALADIEEIWQNQDKVLPYSTFSAIKGVELINASDEVLEWWRQQPIATVSDQLLLAKSMGYPLQSQPKNLIEKIATSNENSFWIKNNSDLFEIYKNITGKICVILDRTSNTLEWLKNFINDADRQGISRSDTRVCFRESKDSKNGINDWIKEMGLGGKVEDGKILIFEYKPAKWLFKDFKDVTMVVTNNLYPTTNQLSRDLFNSHSCVIYLGDIKPSEQKGQKIVEL